MPTLTTEDGRTVDTGPAGAEAINQQFAQAMADDTPDTQAPPRRPDKAPDADKPKPRRGRPPRTDAARTVAAGPVRLDDGQRAAGVQGWVQIGAGLLLMAGKATGNTAFHADAAVVASNAGAIADACVQVARTDARFAAALDKVCASGPYAALISVGVAVGTQCLRNHRPGLALPGTVHPDEIFGLGAPDAPAAHPVS